MVFQASLNSVFMIVQVNDDLKRQRIQVSQAQKLVLVLDHIYVFPQPVRLDHLETKHQNRTGEDAGAHL